MQENLKTNIQAGNWLILGVIAFGCIAMLSAWHHEASTAILFAIATGLCCLGQLRS